MRAQRPRPVPLATLALGLLLAGCGEAPNAPEEREARHRPAHLVGRYAARAPAFAAQLRQAMRVDLGARLEKTDAEAAAWARRLEAASRAWAEALANELRLRADGTLAWRLREATSFPAGQGVFLVDLPPPAVRAEYRGTWWQEAPGEVVLALRTRNGRPLRWPETLTLRIRADGGLDVPWSRDVEIDIEEPPLVREDG